MQILIVDDDSTNLEIIRSVAVKMPGCTVEAFTSPLDALTMAEIDIFDLVLVDYQMPEMDGVDFILRLKRNDAYDNVPIVMITANDARAIKLAAIEAGATDFLNKPVDVLELKARLRNLLALRRSQKQLAGRAKWLTSEVEKATQHLLDAEEEIIWRLAKAIELRDGDTGDHISRVATISRIISRHLGLDDRHTRNIYLATPLHDVGKIGIADAILNKPGRLDPQEMDQMRMHATIGASILSNARSELVRTAEIIAATHHEKWDGTGYPNGLKGEQIPIEGRIAAIADVFDALCSPRPYKAPWPVFEAKDEILRNSGSHFDPRCVEAFMLGWPEIVEIMVHDTSGRSAA